MTERPTCAICAKRRPERFCPAKGEKICAPCCGREREVTLDCPPDCAYLIAAHRYEQQIYDGTRPIVGLNRYRNGADEMPEMELARTPRAKQKLQVDRLTKFKKKNADKSGKALDKLAKVVDRGENCFPALLEAVEVCSLGQITGRLQEVVGRFRPMV